MSKCDLQIVFDRSDRTYRGGEQVTGEICVTVNRDVNCDGLIIERFWRTHGRGNRDSGGRQKYSPFLGQWCAGESYRYPFCFDAPDGPPTYHGRYLNIDHYIGVRVDIPWARDPKAEEEYILLPGPKPYGCRPVARHGRKVVAGLGQFSPMIGAAMIGAGIFLGIPFGIVLIPAGLLVLFIGLWRTLAEQKLGKVQVTLGPHAAPGGRMPICVTFMPKRSSSLNGITARLLGQERCTSGSGTNRTTHTHKLHTSSVTLASQGEVTAGQPIRVDGYVEIPKINAYSFSASNNKIVWEVELRVDIPMWPDWLEKRPITVRPVLLAELIEAEVTEAEVTEAEVVKDKVIEAEAMEAEVEPRAAEEPSLMPRPVMEDPSPPWEPESVPEPPEVVSPMTPFPETSFPETPAPVEQPEARAAPSEDETGSSERLTLTEVIEQISAADRYGREREEIVARQSGRAFDCHLEVTQVDRTYTTATDDRFLGGRTLTGYVSGHKVSVQLIEARNEEVDAARPGDTFSVACTPLQWNSIYDRLDMQEV